jgi:hypothetical protein
VQPSCASGAGGSREAKPLASDLGAHHVAGYVLTTENLERQRVLQVALDCALERPGAVDGVVPLLREEGAGAVREPRG